MLSTTKLIFSLLNLDNAQCCGFICIFCDVVLHTLSILFSTRWIPQGKFMRFVWMDIASHYFNAYGYFYVESGDKRGEWLHPFNEKAFYLFFTVDGFPVVIGEKHLQSCTRNNKRM